MAFCVGLLVALQTGGRDAQALKAWLDEQARDFSGVALVARGDAIEAIGAYGLADRAAGRKNTAETRFNLGSINKTFTAVAIAQLIQQGRISLDDTIGKHIR